MSMRHSFLIAGANGDVVRARVGWSGVVVDQGKIAAYSVARRAIAAC